jgi:hypothetical protein
MLGKRFKFKKLVLSSLFSIFLFLFVQKAEAISFFFETEKDYFQKRDFKIKIKIDPKESSVYAINFELFFNRELLEVEELNAENSIVALWVEKPKNSENKVSFVGGIPNGFRGTFLETPFLANELVEIKFRKKKDITKEDLEQGFLLKSEVFLGEGKKETVETENPVFKEESLFKDDFTFLSGILYNGIRWEIEKVY